MLKLVMLKRHAVFFVCLFVFLALLARNPFSPRTLIPNLEPYPDTIHYLSPVKSLVEGNGFSLYREGRSLKTWVPPLYSAVMVPIFLLHNDVRMFYFANVLLSLTSFLFFYLVLRKFTDNTLITGTVLFLYATNYFNYWYPTLAMGENLVITLFLAALWLLVRKHTPLGMLLFDLLGIAVYATKSANLPITAGLFIGYGFKLIWEGKGRKRFRLVGEHIAVFGIMFILFSVYYQLQYGSSVLSSLFFFLSNMFGSTSKSTGTLQYSGGEWFSSKYMASNLSVYIRAILGSYPARFLWDSTPIVPIYVGIPAIAGLTFSLFSRKTKVIGITLVFILIASILFMSTFYSTDMRYLYHAIPILLLGLALLFSSLKLNGKPRLLIPAAIIVLCFYYAATNAFRLKNQIMLNVRYTESPWYYLSVKNLNGYFADPSKEKPFVITAMIPYFVDFYSNGNYKLLPMSDNQDFYSHKEQVWGTFNNSNLEGIYTRLLKQGKEVYVLNYLGNDPNVSRDFENIKSHFKSDKVLEGCYGSCNIYRLTL